MPSGDTPGDSEVEGADDFGVVERGRLEGAVLPDDVDPSGPVLCPWLEALARRRSLEADISSTSGILGWGVSC